VTEEANNEHRSAKGSKQESLEEAQQRTASLKQELRELRQEQSWSRSGGGASGNDHNEKWTSRPDGIEALRADSMMAHLLEALEAGKDIGHYGRLVFTMVASHFLSGDEILQWLKKDTDVDEKKAAALLQQVKAHDYNPPRRERILEWQREQEFPILPAPDDPDCGNVYKSLKFPDEVYDHIQQYQAEKAEAEDEAA